MIDDLYKFYKSKKIFITGHTGFKGTWLSLWLKLMGSKVCGFSLAPPSHLNFYDLADIDREIISIRGDVRDLNSLQKAVTEFEPDIVIHLAGQAIVRKSYAAPNETFSTNVMGTANMLESVRQGKNIRAVINITSDKCYEDKNYSRGYKESDPMGGFDPYSCSKGCAELITSAYARSFFSPETSISTKPTAIASARAGNVIGGGDFGQDRLIPDIIRSFLSDNPVNIRNPNAIRPWQHVIEPLFGYLLLAWKLYEHGTEFSGPWNFGPDVEGLKNVGYIVDRLATLWGKSSGWTHDQAQHPHESATLELDASKAKALLDWQVRWDIDKTLKHTADWYKCFRDQPEKLPDLSKKQIMAYEMEVNSDVGEFPKQIPTIQEFPDTRGRLYRNGMNARLRRHDEHLDEKLSGFLHANSAK